MAGRGNAAQCAVRKEVAVSLGLALAALLVGRLAQTLAAGHLALDAPSDVYSWIELVGFSAGIAGVYLMVIESVWNYPVGLVWAVAYAWYFFASARMYGDGTVSLITVAYLAEGWFRWARGSGSKPLDVRRAGKADWLAIALTVLVGVPVVAWILTTFKGMYPLIDASTACLSLAAQYLTNRKVLESWLVWVFVDVVLVGLFIYRGFYPSAILYVVFTVMGLAGFRSWRAELRKPV